MLNTVITSFVKLCVDRGTFLNHIKRRKGDDAWFIKRLEEMSVKIRQVFEENNQVYGAKKIAAVLRSQGKTVSDQFVSNIMKDMNLKSIRTTSKKEHLRDRRRQNILKAIPHKDCAEDAQTDFSSDCIEITQAY